MNLRPLARSLFLETLERVQISDVIRKRVYSSDGSLHFGGLIYSIEDFSDIMVIAIGKAAVPMCQAVLPSLEAAICSGQVLRGVVVGASVPDVVDERFQYFRGGHPEPNQISRKAADTVLQLLERANTKTLVIYLLSGGSSAMLEYSLDPTITLEETAAFHHALVHSGLPIASMNALRKHFSRVKGGRLAVVARGATQCSLIVSDVPEDMLDVVGSGPSLPDSSTVSECRRIIDSSSDNFGLSSRVLAFFRRPDFEETPKADHPAFRNASWLCLLSSTDLAAHAAQLASRHGFEVVIDNDCDEWNYEHAARYLVGRLIEMRRTYTKACVISAGEVSVKLTGEHGVGGRNQQFTLECARLLAKENLDFTVLSAGSDGIDGNSPAAGAVADRTTWIRAAELDVNPERALKTFNSFPLFESLSDAIEVGHTGNNLRDLRILLCNQP